MELRSVSSSPTVAGKMKELTVMTPYRWSKHFAWLLKVRTFRFPSKLKSQLVNYLRTMKRCCDCSDKRRARWNSTELSADHSRIVNYVPDCFALCYEVLSISAKVKLPMNQSTLSFADNFLSLSI